MVDGRTKKERLKKWIRGQREFGKKFMIDTRAVEQHIKMRMAGWDNIAGLDKKAIKSMGYKNTDKMKIMKYLPETDDYFVIWKKRKKGVVW